MKYTRMLALCAAALLLLLSNGCEVTIYQLGNATGTVIDADSGDPIAGATVGLYVPGASSPSRTARTNTNGEYGFSAISVGIYELIASYSDGTSSTWVFTEETVEVAWDENTAALPTIAGFAYDAGTDAGNVKIIALWDPSFYDVDAYLTIPDGDKVNGDNDVLYSSTGIDGEDFYDFNATPSNALPGFNPDNSAGTGFSPTLGNVAIGDRNAIFYAGAGSYNMQITDGGGYVLAEMNVENSGASGQALGGPETITLHYGVDVTETGTSFEETGSNGSGLPLGTYTWTGVYEYYLVAWNATDSSGEEITSSRLSTADNNNAANPRVFVFGGSTLIGRYETPKYTDVRRASILRINTFRANAGAQNGTEYFQILPDQRVMPDVRALDNLTPAVVKAGNRE